MLILSFTATASDPRILKQIQLLHDRYQVTTAGFGSAPWAKIRHITLAPEGRSKGLLRVRGAYFGALAARRFRWLSTHNPRSVDAYEKLSGEAWDLVIANDVQTVGVALELKPVYGVLADLHEYAPRQNEHSFAWRVLIAPYFRWIVSNQVSRAARVTTVSRGIVEEYRREFGIQSDLVINATPYWNLTPKAMGAPIKLVHSGVPGRARRLDVMIEGVLRSSADVTLDLYLMNTDVAELKRLRQVAGNDPRIRFKDPVPYSDLVETLNKYDVGVSLIAPSTFNLEWSLPNKLFDYVQARLGILVGPSVEMAAFIDGYGLGAVAEDFSPAAFAELLNSLNREQVSAWKTAAHQSARELSAERLMEPWAKAVSSMLSGVRQPGA